MTCDKNFVFLLLTGIALLGLGGCESQPYKPWQPGDSWWEKDRQASAETGTAETAPPPAAAEEPQQAAPAVQAEPAPMAVSPAVMQAEPARARVTVEQPAPRQDDSEPSAAPPPMVIMEPEVPLASEANAPARTTSGDVLLIDSIQSGGGIKTPRNGMSMDSVRSQFGSPLSEGSSIGDPPITRWEYKGFSVYFERDLVLHSVVHRTPRN